MNIRNYIDGAFSDPVGGQFLDNIDPSTGNAYGIIPRSQAADVDLAVAAAKAAFPAWSSLSAAERSDAIFATFWCFVFAPDFALHLSMLIPLLSGPALPWRRPGEG